MHFDGELDNRNYRGRGDGGGGGGKGSKRIGGVEKSEE